MEWTSWNSPHSIGFEGSSERKGTVNKDFQRVYSLSVDLVAETWGNMASDRVPNPLPVRRLITDLIDMSKDSQDEQMLTLAGDEDAPEYVRHPRCLLPSILIGAAVGLSDASLSDLGVAAMFHGVGYTKSGAGGDVEHQEHPMEAGPLAAQAERVS